MQDNKDEENNNIQDNLPSQIKDAINSLPEDEKEKINKIISFSAMGTMRAPSPIEKVITPEHITAIISNSDKEDERAFQSEKANKAYLFGGFVISLVFFIALIILLADKNPDLLIKIISHVGAVILGLMGGYSLGYNKCKKEEE